VHSSSSIRSHGCAPAGLIACALVSIALAGAAHAGEEGPSLHPASAVSVGGPGDDYNVPDEVNATSYTGGESVLRFVRLPPIAASTQAIDANAAAQSVETVEAVAPAASASVLIDNSPDFTASCIADSTAEADGDSGDHELWIVSTRDLPGAECGCPAPEFQPRVERYVCGSGWVGSTLEEFVASDDATRVTAIFIHGNDTDPAEAEARGRQLYRQLLTSRCAVPATRLVIWSWPSEQVLRHFRRDAQLKACRTNIEGYYLARFVDQLAPQTPLSIGGYSYGARVATGGLHLLGGGVLDGRQLVERMHADRQPASVVLLGAAMANNWLLPGMRHDRALSQVERMVILFNPADFVLHWYPRLWGHGGPEALGATGLAAPAQLGPERAKVTQVNVRSQLHCRHAWDNVSASSSIMSLVQRELVLLPATGTK
jgi:hypothetical protein